MKKLSTTIFALIFVFGLSAQEKISVPDVSLEKKYENMTNQLNYFITVSIKYVEEKDFSVKEYATYIGNQFKTSWDKKKGYEGFVNGMLYNLVSFTYPSKVEIVERTESSITIKSAIMGEYLIKYPEYYTSHEKYSEFFTTISSILGDYMGCIYESEIKDDHMLVTISKK